MEECEICGRPAGTLYTIELEGARIMVCERCAKGKEVLETIDLTGKAAGRPEHYKVGKEAPQEDEIVDNYGEVIRRGREAMGLPLKVLAERIAEKESTMLRVEEQKTLPSATLAKKLEKELGIKLTVKAPPKGGPSSFGKGGPVTLGDAAFKSRWENKREGDE